jgi:hypothetical protein
MIENRVLESVVHYSVNYEPVNGYKFKNNYYFRRLI